MAKDMADTDGRGRTLGSGTLCLTGHCVGRQGHLALVLAICVLTAWLPLAHSAISGVREKDPCAREYCDWEFFNATCAADEVMVISSAMYGRMRLGRCVTQDYGHLGCGTDLTADFDLQCSGKISCNVSIISLHKKQSDCPAEFKNYLEASYNCVKVSAPSQDTCKGYSRPQPELLKAPSGAIASVHARRTLCPWRIQVEPFQHIQLTLVDFSVPQGANPWLSNPKPVIPAPHCQPYASVAEGSPLNNSVVNVTICGSGKRETSVYTSTTNVIDLHVTSAYPNKKFIIKYKALGCRPLVAPADAYVESEGDQATVQCNSTEEAWHLTCTGTVWVGQIGNCSSKALKGSGEGWNINVAFGDTTTFPFGILIVVALGVAIGVAIGVVMLVLVLAYMRRRKWRKVRSRSNYILKPVSECGDDPSKMTCSECHTDCTPMLYKREAMDECSMAGSTPCSRRHYSCSWPRNRPLPQPANGSTTRSGTPHEDLVDVDMDGVVLAPELHATSPSRDFNTLPGQVPQMCPNGTIYSVSPRNESIIPSVFTTFKPVRSMADMAPNGPYIVEGMRRREDGPYYFKFDAAGSHHEHAHKPDLVQGCALCHANAVNTKHATTPDS